MSFLQTTVSRSVVTLLESLSEVSNTKTSLYTLRPFHLRLLLTMVAVVLYIIGAVACYGQSNLSGQLALKASDGSSAIYLQYNKVFSLELCQQSMSAPAAGYQADISFDTNMLTFVSGNYIDSPYGQPTIPITLNADTISIGATTLPEQSPSSANAKLSNLTLQTGSEEGSTRIRFNNARIYSLNGDLFYTLAISSLRVIIDNTPPTISAVSDVIQANDSGLCQANISVCGPIVNDSVSGVESITGIRSDNRSVFDPYPVGTTTITWTATDKAGNTAQSTQTITVTDTEAPSIIAPISITTSTDSNSGYASKANVNLGSPTVSDNCAIVSVTNDAPDQFPAGTTTVTWTVTDVNGNSATATQSVIVYDNRPIIIFREDDCRDTWRKVFPEFDNHSAYEYGMMKKIPVTWAVITSLSTGQGPLTWTEIKNYMDTAGGEAASHSITHVGLSSQQAYIDEIAQSKQAINANLGPKYQCTSFIQPGAWTGDAYVDNFAKLDNPIGQAIQANYQQSMAYAMTTGWMMGGIYYKYGLISSMPIDYPCPTIDKINATLDLVAATPGLIHTVYCHGIQSPTGTTTYAVPSNVMRAVMDKLALLRDQGRVRLMGLHDAYSAVFSPGINLVPNPGFETFTEGYSEPCIPWALRGNASAVAGQGRNSSRCLRIAGQNAGAKIDALLIGPGRYKYTWYQKCENGYSLSYPVGAMLDNYGYPYTTTERKVVNYQTFYNTKVDEWQQMSVLVKVKDRLGKLFMDLYTYPPASCQGSFLIDDVSCVSAPLDPAVSPVNISLLPDPDGCTVSWDTPNDSSIESIECRYGTRNHPQTLSEGTSIGTAKPAAGHQSMWFKMNWGDKSLSNAYFSIFAVRKSGASEPDIDYLIIDKTAPSVSNIAITPNGPNITISWVSKDSESSVYSSQYAVGTTSGGSDVVSWTSTSAASVTLANLPTGIDLYFSVKSQNVYGFWSQPQTVSFTVPASVLSVVHEPDGSRVIISGVVTAVYSDCYYIEQSNVKKGIKIIGGYKPGEGDTVSVTGILATCSGERAVLAQ